MDTIDYDFMSSALLSVANIMEQGYTEETSLGELEGGMEAVGPDMLGPALTKYGIDPDALIEHVTDMIGTLRQRGIVTHPMGASIVATQFIKGIFMGMQMAQDREERANPEAAFFGNES